MNLRYPLAADARIASIWAPAAVAAMLRVACGGGGNSLPGFPTVSSSSATGANGQPVMYSRQLLITLNGSSLDGGLSVTSPGCQAGPVLSTAAPYVSSATTAYYLCTVSGLGASQVNVARASDSAVLATPTYTVPMPQVTVTAKNVPPGSVNGVMVFTLAPDKTPVTVQNFLAYVNNGFYDGTVFHNAVSGFVIEGGVYLPITPGVAPVAQTPLGNAIALEVGRGLSNTQWSIAMGRAGAPDPVTSQFFINVVDNSARLDPGPTAGNAVFGAVTTGTAVASSIFSAPTPCTPLAGIGCVPSPNVVITATQTQ